jgi:hypothetical protein
MGPAVVALLPPRTEPKILPLLTYEGIIKDIEQQTMTQVKYALLQASNKRS